MATTHTHAASSAALLKKPCYPEPLTNTNKHKIKMSQNYESDNTRLDSGRAAIFVDGSNLFYAALQLGIEIDYTKLLTHLTANARLLRAFSTPAWIAPTKSNRAFCCGCAAMVIESSLKI